MRTLEFHLDEPPDVNGPDPLESQSRKRVLHRLALRVEDTGLGPDEDGSSNLPRPSL